MFPLFGSLTDMPFTNINDKADKVNKGNIYELEETEVEADARHLVQLGGNLMNAWYSLDRLLSTHDDVLHSAP